MILHASLKADQDGISCVPLLCTREISHAIFKACVTLFTISKFHWPRSTAPDITGFGLDLSLLVLCLAHASLQEFPVMNHICLNFMCGVLSQCWGSMVPHHYLGTVECVLASMGSSKTSLLSKVDREQFPEECKYNNLEIIILYYKYSSISVSAHLVHLKKIIQIFSCSKDLPSTES